MDKKTRKRIDLAIEIILVIIIILLLLYNYALIKSGKRMKVPTGNVDIIEITCDKGDICKPDSGKKDEPTPGKDDEPDVGVVIVEDQEITWDKTTPARIFTNSMYELEGVVAPEDENTYQFVVKNSIDSKIKYKISFVENNPYNINMKYQLKKNDAYLTTDYVSASELNLEEALLDANANDTFYLDWKWVSSSNDTQIGSNPEAKYILQIEIKAESVNE